MEQKKYVLITGVSTGIGHDATGYLIGKGYHVLGSVRKESDFVSLTKQYPNDFTCLKFDVTKMDEVNASIDLVKRVLGDQKLSGLINNAGFAVGGPMELLSDEKFRYQMDVNLFAVRNVTNVFLPFLKGDKKREVQGGKIIMISSVSGVFNTPFSGAYCISKHALESLAETYRRELMMYDIDVVSIQPGPIKTKIWDKNIDKYIEYSDTEYGKLMGRANKMAKKAERNALPASVISKLIYKILTKRKTRLRYIINKNWLLTVFFVKYMPSRWVDQIFYKQFFK